MQIAQSGEKEASEIEVGLLVTLSGTTRGHKSPTFQHRDCSVLDGSMI